MKRCAAIVVLRVDVDTQMCDSEPHGADEALFARITEEDALWSAIILPKTWKWSTCIY